MTQRNRAISTEEQLVIALRFFASGSFLQVIGDTHGYDKATVSRIVRRVSLALANKHETWVKFPTRMEDKNAIRAGMYEIAGFPCVIDASTARTSGYRRPVDTSQIMLRWLDTVFKNSGVQHFDMFKLRIFRIYSADIGFFIYFDISTFKLY